MKNDTSRWKILVRVLGILSASVAILEGAYASYVQNTPLTESTSFLTGLVIILLAIEIERIINNSQ